MRPQTYESEAESKVLSYVFAGRSGLENTSFALLDPGGKKLTRGSRSPSMTYGSTEKFAAALQSTAARYAKKAKPIEALPTVRDLRLALNVAAADMRPLVIVRGKDKKDAQKLADSVAKLAWADASVGAAHYVVLDEAQTFEGLTPELGVTIVQPDPYGRGGEVLGHSASSAKQRELATAMQRGLAKHKATAREHDDHIREARRRDIGWDSEVPVSDPHEKRGRRGRRKRGSDDDG